MGPRCPQIVECIKMWNVEYRSDRKHGILSSATTGREQKIIVLYGINQKGKDKTPLHSHGMKAYVKE